MVFGDKIAVILREVAGGWRGEGRKGILGFWKHYSSSLGWCLHGCVYFGVVCQAVLLDTGSFLNVLYTQSFKYSCFTKVSTTQCGTRNNPQILLYSITYVTLEGHTG